MRLIELLKDVEYKLVQGSIDIEVDDIAYDSRKVYDGVAFVALKGFRVDGHDYIEDAIKAGATKIVCEHGSYSVETLVVPSNNCSD